MRVVLSHKRGVGNRRDYYPDHFPSALCPQQPLTFSRSMPCELSPTRGDCLILICTDSLFDMDGTLVYLSLNKSRILFHGLQINSIAGIEGAWESFANTYPGLNVPEILARKVYRCSLSALCSDYSTEAHGIRTADSLRRYCGLEDPKVLEMESARFEMEIIDASKKEGRQGIVPVPGAKEAVHVLEVIARTPAWCFIS